MMRLIHFHLKGHCKVVFENETGWIFLATSANGSLLLARTVFTSLVVVGGWSILDMVGTDAHGGIALVALDGGLSPPPAWPLVISKMSL